MSRIIKEVPTIKDAQKLIGATIKAHPRDGDDQSVYLVVGVSLDEDRDLRLSLAGDRAAYVSPHCLRHWIEVLEEGPNYCAPETIQEKEARLAQELADVREEIARDGAPEGCAWSDHRDKPCLEGRGFRVCFNDGGHEQVFVRDTSGRSFLAIPLDMVFAWVDKVREDSQT